jgi:hypothetical protein
MTELADKAVPVKSIALTPKPDQCVEWRKDIPRVPAMCQPDSEHMLERVWKLPEGSTIMIDEQAKTSPDA